jgi:GNAT superfamily N-acetyltransferase
MSGHRAVQVERGDDASLREWYDVHSTAFGHDHAGLPDDPWEEFRERQLEVRDDTLREVWLLRDASGAAVAGARLALPTKDNTDVVEVDLVVHPEHRRAGAGSALLDAVRRRAVEHGRARLVGEVGGPFDRALPGEAFAAHHGASSALDEVRRVLDLRALDEERLDRLRADAASRAASYEVVTWTGCPDEGLLEDLALLQARMSTDAPQGDLAWEPEQWDAARVRAYYERVEAVGRLVVSTAVRDLRSGRLVGNTDIGVSRFAPETGYQWNTIVLTEHRGHRLGTLLKVDNVRALREVSPATRWLHTWNAAANRHMVAINEALGFTPVERWAQWVLAL